MTNSVKPVYVLDTCAFLRLAQDEPGADRVAEILTQAQNEACQVLLHQINLGEVVYRIGKAFGWAVAESKQADIELLPIKLVAFSDSVFLAAVKLKYQYPMSYADCFAAALAIQKQATLLTSDPEFGVLGEVLDILKI